MNKRFMRWAPVALALLLFGAFSVTVSLAQGGVLTVDNGNPNCDNTTGVPFCSLDAAVDTAPPGATIRVAPGDYLVGLGGPPLKIIDRDLNIVGAGPEQTIIRPGNNTLEAGDARGWWVIQPGVAFNVRDVTLDGTAFQIWQAFRYHGRGSLDNVQAVNLTFQEDGPPYQGTVVAAFGDGPVNVTNSQFEGIGRIGVLYFGEGVVGSVFENNSYTGKGDGDWLDYAVEVGAGANVTITNNVIRGNTGVAEADGSTSAGILVSTVFGEGSNAVIMDNTLEGNTTGVLVGLDETDTSSVTATNNCFLQNEIAISSAVAVVEAGGNWWGDVAGPVVGGRNGVGNNALVVFQPVLSEEPPTCMPASPQTLTAPPPAPTEPPPPPARPCVEFGNEPGTDISANVPATTVTDGTAFCRVIARGGVFERNAAEIGVQSVLDLGVIHAIDVFGLTGGGSSVQFFNNAIEMCLSGPGNLVYLDATQSPRTVQRVQATERDGFTCGSIPNAGIILLTERAPS